jgi:peptidoglycan/xylan/chitin deacetylase (PgdA/CDA1 family)
LFAVACANYEQGGETVFVLGQAQQPVLMEGAVFGEGLPAKTVILTYDDGPDEHTLELAQYLHDNDIQATFFINGRRICKTLGDDGTCLVPMDTRACDDGLSQAPVADPIYYPESLLREIVLLGHRLANHTVDHCHLPAQDTAENFVFELQGTQDIIDRHICDGLYLFRAPYGEWDAQAAALAQASPGLDKLIGPIQWDIDGLDWSCYQQGTPIATCGDGYLDILRERAQQNGIFLLHDRPEFNVGIEGPLLLAQYMVPILKEEGFQFTTLDALLEFTPQGPMACPDAAGGSGGGGAGGASAAGGGGSSGEGGAGGNDVGGGGLGGSGGSVIAQPQAGAGGTVAVAGGGSAGSSGMGVAAPALPGAAGAPATSSNPSDVEQETSCALSIPQSQAAARRSWSALWLAALGVALGRRRRCAQMPRQRRA